MTDMTPRWYDRAVDELEEEYASGHLTTTEFNAAMRDLNSELHAAADEAAEEARDSYMGGW